jgi:AraC-like DNA-binding protein
MESMSETVRYSERRSAVVPATVWRRRGPATRTDILPDGCMDLIWTGSALMIAGPDTGPVTVDDAHAADMTALRFDPGVAPLVFGCPATEMLNGRFALDDVWPARTARLLTDEVAASDDPATVLQRCAADRLGSRPPPRWLGPATSLLAAGRPVGEVSDTIGASPRQLQRWSRHHYGYGAKTLQRILRVNEALARLRTGAPLSDVASECGYADYPHMFREFRAVTLRTPAELLDRQPA